MSYVKDAGLLKIEVQLNDMTNIKGQKMDYALGSGHVVDIPVEISDRDLEQINFVLLVRYLPSKL